MIIQRLLERHPYLSDIPEDSPDGIDSPLPTAPPINWTGAGTILPTAEEERSSRYNEYSDDEEGEGEEAAPPTWSDWALFLGGEIMADVRGEIWKRLHYTCSAGIAHNKAMAKVSQHSVFSMKGREQFGS